MDKGTSVDDRVGVYAVVCIRTPDNIDQYRPIQYVVPADICVYNVYTYTYTHTSDIICLIGPNVTYSKHEIDE